MAFLRFRSLLRRRWRLTFPRFFLNRFLSWAASSLYLSWSSMDCWCHIIPSTLACSMMVKSGRSHTSWGRWSSMKRKKAGSAFFLLLRQALFLPLRLVRRRRWCCLVTHLRGLPVFPLLERCLLFHLAMSACLGLGFSSPISLLFWDL